MRCHYEVLNVSRDADDPEIKSAYKKLALKWHPDKNLEDVENAKEQFQLVQQAYEVLSDRQERAWYDRHREQILCGANSEFSDENLDVFQYFTTSCFKGYNDDDNGFYTIYRNVFEQIAKEDMDFYEDKDDFCSIPSFGSSTSDYDSIVKPFYAHWMSYTTKKSYVWLDPYNIRDIRDRRLLKAVEKENKKIRQKAKKERNEEIRNLVSFVRKRDKRVQTWNKLNEAKIEVNRRKQEEIRKQKREERRKLNESEVQAEWTKFENVSSELQEIEKNLQSEFGHSDLSDSENESDLYCAACNKLFKTEKSFQNHESSKKHKENVELLRTQMLEEDAEYESIESDAELDKESSNEEINKQSTLPSNTLTNDETSSEDDNVPQKEKDSEASKNESKKQTKYKKNRNVLKIDSSDEEQNVSILPDTTSSEDDFNTAKKGKKKNKKSKIKKSTTAAVSTKVETSISKEENEEDLEKNQSVLHVCSTCHKDFPSKNKLFQHLRKEGHSIFSVDNHSKSKVKKKK